jgi:inorganic phosphate transporter, PiT family
MEPATLGLALIIGLIAVALLFDAMNGLHDAANSIATIVSTNVLSPKSAVLWAAFFNFIAFLVLGLQVAKTLGTGIVAEEAMDAAVIFAGLFGAIAWDAITWWAGLPSSSSHALVGGLVGAGLAKAGSGAIVWSGITKTVVAIVISPLIGLALALFAMVGSSWIVMDRHAAEPVCGRPHVSHPAVLLRFALLVGPWRQ